ncbi:hypothetical protein AB8S44_29570, partial [Klebsiella quasipneumoniae subsp. similipneumoniae]|uniref:hypothetical protein n=1 Tax=Klebsiella quasipneumoniae TaxID=1463165 RepID=UPI0038D01B90
STYDLGNVSDSGSLSRYSKSTVRRHRRVSHFEVEFAKISTIYSLATQGTIKIVLGAAQLIDT